MPTKITNARVDGKLVDITVEGGAIAAVQPAAGAPGDYDAAGRVTIPGFVDCHLHLDKCLLAERAPYQDLSGPEKGALTREQKATFTVEDITNRAERMIKRAIAAGTVALRTNVDVDAIVGLKGIEALLALREKYKDTLTIQVAAFAQEGIFADGQTDKLLEEALKMGADVIAGHTIAAGEGEKAIDFVLALAQKYGLPADFHLDESGNPANYLLPYTADKMRVLGLEGRVNAIHMCTLGALGEDELEKAMEYVQAAKIKATIAPTAISTRVIAPVKRLLAVGAPVGLGSDNIRDFFNPLGSADVKQMALLLSYLQRFYLPEEVQAVFRMITAGGAEVLGLSGYGIAAGNPANITVLAAQDEAVAVADEAQPVYMLRRGKLLPA